MYISIMISNKRALTFTGGLIHFNKLMNDSMYVDLGFKERIAAIPSMIWKKEEDTEFDDFII